MVLSLTDISFNVRGKCADRVYYVSDGVQYVRAHFIPDHPLSDMQVNTWDAFGKISSLFAALPQSLKKSWSDFSNLRKWPKPNLFCSRGMHSYREQLGIGTQAYEVEVEGLFPGDSWKWLEK